MTQFVVYLVGPFLLAYVLGRRWLGVSWLVFWVGFPAFFVSQLGVSLFSIAGALGGKFVGGSVVLWTTVLGAAGAGICEEACRYWAFGYLLRRNKRISWERGVMYAIGHSGLETILVGLGLLTAIWVATATPEVLPVEALEGILAMSETSEVRSLLLAIERLLGGFIIHASFTTLVVLSVTRSDKRFLCLAMLWHALHDAVFFQEGVQSLMAQSDVAHVGIIGSLLVVYLAILISLRGVTAGSSPPVRD